MGPPNDAPKLFFLCGGLGETLGASRRREISRLTLASSLSFRRYSNASPCHWLVPPLLVMTVWLPIVTPYSAPNMSVTTRYSRMPSTPSVFPPGEAELAPCWFTRLVPSSVMLFERRGAPLLLIQVPFVPLLISPTFTALETPG